MKYFYVTYVNEGSSFGHTIFKGEYLNIGLLLDFLKEKYEGTPVIINWQEINEQQAHEYNDYINRFKYFPYKNI